MKKYAGTTYNRAIYTFYDELRNVYKNEPVFAGNTISHFGAKVLTNFGLLKRNQSNEHILTIKGRFVYHAHPIMIYCRVRSFFRDY